MERISDNKLKIARLPAVIGQNEIGIHTYFLDSLYIYIDFIKIINLFEC